jgi:hypothetical protein
MKGKRSCSLIQKIVAMLFFMTMVVGSGKPEPMEPSAETDPTAAMDTSVHPMDTFEGEGIIDPTEEIMGQITRYQV